MDHDIRYVCKFCDRIFSFKDVFDNHRPVCEYFHQSKKDRLHDIESFEPLPSPNELFRMVQHLTKKCNDLELEVKNLKACASIRTRNMLQQYLRKLTKPTCTFSEWIKGFHVSYDDLDVVFQPHCTLMDGLKKCIQNRMLMEGLANAPIQTFTEKRNTIYVYDVFEETAPISWKICSNEVWNKLVDGLCHSFLKAFCEWEEDQEDVIHSSPEKRDVHIQNMSKISHIPRDKQRGELRNWFISKFIQTI